MSNRLLFHIVRNQNPLVAEEHMAVRDACQLMWQRRTGAVLVVDRERRLVGIFTGRDVVQLLSKRCDPSAIALRDAMTAKPVTLTPQDRAIDALRAMAEGGFRHVPIVVDSELMGVVSRGDLKGMEFEEFSRRELGLTGRSATSRSLGEVVSQRRPVICMLRDHVGSACRLMSEEHVGAVLVLDARQRLRGVFTGRDAVRTTGKYARPCDVQIARAMTPDPHSLPPDATTIDALRAMNDGGFRHIPVVSAGKCLGIVSRQDFTGMELDRPDEEERLRECIW